MAKKVTLDDIAAATNLSKFSVSRAIAGKVGLVRKPEKLYWKHVKGWAM